MAIDSFDIFLCHYEAVAKRTYVRGPGIELKGFLFSKFGESCLSVRCENVGILPQGFNFKKRKISRSQV